VSDIDLLQQRTKSNLVMKFFGDAGDVVDSLWRRRAMMMILGSSS
jgi:hypothetical protein